MRLFTSALVLSSFVLVALPQTQAQTGDLAGTVRDNAGSVVSGAVVSLESAAVLQHTTLTDGRGEFRFRGVAAGSYDLTISASGLNPARRPVRIVAGNNPRMTVVLQPAEIAEVERRSYPNAKGVQESIRVDGGVVGGVVGGTPAAPSSHDRARSSIPFNTEAYDRIHDNSFRQVADHPLSTFSVDVDTASYSNVRRFLINGALPPPDAVRTEELINYFRFDYPQPGSEAPFSISTEVAACPWNPAHRLALIGLQGRRMPDAQTPPRNLVFLLDVSGSMPPPTSCRSSRRPCACSWRR